MMSDEMSLPVKVCVCVRIIAEPLTLRASRTPPAHPAGSPAALLKGYRPGNYSAKLQSNGLANQDGAERIKHPKA
ncbi:MAG: hypothetical protein K6U78_15105, partial [Anaerolineae bacterium]|nr:hypothetical protein [Anaerolineae bacterium]